MNIISIDIFFISINIHFSPIDIENWTKRESTPLKLSLSHHSFNRNDKLDKFSKNIYTLTTIHFQSNWIKTGQRRERL